MVEKSRSKSKSRYKNLECHFCHKTGHIQKYCFKWKKKNKDKKGKQRENDHDEKVEHYIRIKTHKPISLRFWVESGVSVLCG